MRHHIRHTHEKLKQLSWCGKPITQFDWVFLDLDHAAYSNGQGSIEPCRRCITAARNALAGKRITALASTDPV